MDEGRKIRVADEDAGVEIRRRVDRVVTVACDEDRGQPIGTIRLRHGSSPTTPGCSS